LREHFIKRLLQKQICGNITYDPQSALIERRFNDLSGKFIQRRKMNIRVGHPGAHKIAAQRNPQQLPRNNDRQSGQRIRFAIRCYDFDEFPV
jgi:hypothetical protein